MDVLSGPHSGRKQRHDKGVAAPGAEIPCLGFLHTKPKGGPPAVEGDGGTEPCLSIYVLYVSFADLYHKVNSFCLVCGPGGWRLP